MAEVYEPPKLSMNYGTEYTDNYNWDSDRAMAGSRNKEASGLFDPGMESKYQPTGSANVSYGHTGGATLQSEQPAEGQGQIDPAIFPSQIYPSVYRETIVRKDDRGKYIDPFKDITTKAYGRRLMYDESHPDKMYASMPSSELADHPGCYSFPTTTGLDPEIPFNRDLQWQANAETGQWPTDLWKGWTHTAISPTYDGHDDQAEYSKLKVQLP